MTPAQIRAAVDTKLAALWATIQAKETTYAANHAGRYWQGLRTHNANPAEGLEVLPDIGTTTPSDQTDPWPLALRTSLMPMSLQIDVYDGPEGTGYTATVWVSIGGVVWTRTANNGPETWRASGWHVFTATSPGEG